MPGLDCDSSVWSEAVLQGEEGGIKNMAEVPKEQVVGPAAHSLLHTEIVSRSVKTLLCPGAGEAALAIRKIDMHLKGQRMTFGKKGETWVLDRETFFFFSLI